MIESVGGQVLADSVAAVCRNGRVITCGAHAGEQVALDIIEIFRKHVMLHGSHYASKREVAHVFGLIAAGKLTPVIAARLPLEDVHEAARRTAERDFFGKMILLP